MKTLKVYINEAMNQPLRDFMEAVHLCNNQIKLADVKVESTKKGNWVVYHNAKEIGTVAGSLLTNEQIDAHNLRYKR